MPTQNQPIEPSAFRELQRRVERLEAENHRDAGRKLVTVDRLTTANLPAPSEGQLAVEHSSDVFKYYANSQWRTPGGGTTTAIGVAGSRSQSLSGGVLNLMWDSIYTNDAATFNYEQVTSGRAQYITITGYGLYVVQVLANWDTSFATTDFPYLEATCYISGVQNTLINTASIEWHDMGGIIYGEQFSADDVAHKSLVGTVYFDYNATDFSSDTTVGIGFRIRASSNPTKSFGGQIVISKLGSAMSSVTII